MTSGLFKLKHSEFLDAIERVWVRFLPETRELQIFLQSDRRLPPNWIRGELTLSACDTRGCSLSALSIKWSDVFGSPVVGLCPCPAAFLPRAPGQHIANIGDFVLQAGGRERTRPNMAASAVMPANDADDGPREDIIMRMF